MFDLTFADFIQVIILAVVQGVTEFLPISSSGHLVAVESLLGRHTDSAEMSIVLHFGTLLAILVYYHKQVLALLREDKRVVPLLVLGTLPAAILGIWLKTNHEAILKNALLAGFMLPITGFILMLLTKIKPGKKEYTHVGILAVLMIGLSQAFALLPGISRSGSTIVMGALMGLRPKAAATFAFLLAIPAIGGAASLEFREIMEQGADTPAVFLIVGTVISFVVGLASLHWLIRWIEQGKLHLFAYWVIPVGFLLVVWQLNLIVSSA